MPNPRYDADILVACPADDCHAPVGEPCVGLPDRLIRFGRRMHALLKERGATVEELKEAMRTGAPLPGCNS